MTRRLLFISHGDVLIDRDVPVPEWPLNARGRARHWAFARGPDVSRVTSIYASSERKARDGAEILAAARGLAVHVDPALGENDRSATGFLPRVAFEAMADAFFAQPDQSVRGWERARDAQARICQAVTAIVATDAGAGDIAVVAHGAVGALFLCDRLGVAISRAHDQPGQGGGNFMVCTLPDLALVQGWQDIAPECVG